MTQCDGQHGGYRKREIVFVVTKKGNLAAYNKRTEKIEYLEITNRGKLKYIGAEKKMLECGIDPNSRPQDLEPNDFVKLSKVLI